VCAKCEKPFLGHRHYEKKGLAYCETHYHQLFGNLCFICNQVITGDGKSNRGILACFVLLFSEFSLLSPKLWQHWTRPTVPITFPAPLAIRFLTPSQSFTKWTPSLSARNVTRSCQLSFGSVWRECMRWGSQSRKRTRPVSQSVVSTFIWNQ